MIIIVALLVEDGLHKHKIYSPCRGFQLRYGLKSSRASKTSWMLEIKRGEVVQVVPAGATHGLDWSHDEEVRGICRKSQKSHI